MYYYVFLFIIIAIAIFLFRMGELPKIKSKNLSFVITGLGVNLLTISLAYFIGGMATDSPTSNILDFWKGFLFI